MQNKTCVKIGQIGIGHNHAAEKMATLRKLNDEFEVVGIVEPDPAWRARRGQLAVYQDLPWMTEEQLLNIKGLQAVAVETDVCDLVATASRCVDAGMHLHLDKPGGESLAAFQALLRAAERKRLTVQMGYMYRNNTALRFCARAVREGWLGRVFEIHAVMSRMDGDEYRKWLAQFPGGAMFIFGGHLIDIIVGMLGRPERVAAFQRQTFPERDDLHDNGLAVLEYPQATATIRTAVVETEGFKRRQFVVCGDQGTIDIRPIEPLWPKTGAINLQLALAQPKGGFKAGYQTVVIPPMPGRYDEQLRELAGIVGSEQAHPYSIEHDLMVEEILLAAAGYPAGDGLHARASERQ